MYVERSCDAYCSICPDAYSACFAANTCSAGRILVDCRHSMSDYSLVRVNLKAYEVPPLNQSSDLGFTCSRLTLPSWIYAFSMMRCFDLRSLAPKTSRAYQRRPRLSHTQ